MLAHTGPTIPLRVKPRPRVLYWHLFDLVLRVPVRLNFPQRQPSMTLIKPVAEFWSWIGREGLRSITVQLVSTTQP
jgi:hypothetical protein